ncbi:integrator complex subunit 6-like [Sminthopsis crassicaudata]|uniref:integrator complex subunit 6-like n=1 Tax=Sminthopsis crassicaudata TaxID=9301 RepID=UPI003D693A29
MPIILFLLDTSASMNQRTEMGTTYLDIAKNSVEVFLKLRSRDPNSRLDRYMLVTSEDPPYCIKAGWKESHATFMTELKNLHASGLTTLGQALKSSFDLLNLNRLVSGIDSYGQGRNPFFLEPSLLIVITDGNKLTCPTGVIDDLHLPLTSPLPGSELTKEPFRWDQRVFALVLRIPGTYVPDPEPLGSIPMDDSIITQLCEITGGRSYCIRSHKMLSYCLETLVQKIQIGVVVKFEKAEVEPVLPPEEMKGKKDAACNTPESLTSSGQQQWHSSRKLIFVRANPKTGIPVGHWPIPESFWPDQNSPTLPPRAAHPIIRFFCVDCEPMLIEKLPFDKYELEPSALTQHILDRKSPQTCWQVFVANSGKHSGLEHPFGYLKASTSLTCVNLIVLPYNYPVLLPLLDELFRVHKLNPSPKWLQEFDEYLKFMPSYFLSPLKKALRFMGASNLVIENLESGLSYSIITYLKKLNQQSKVEAEKRNALVGKKPPVETGIKVKTFSVISSADFHSHLKPLSSSTHVSLIELNGKEQPTFELALPKKGAKPHLYTNPFDIPRSCLLDQLTRMRASLLNTFTNVVGQNEDFSHSIPIMQMGNYQEYLKTAPPPLREVDSEQPKRLHGFGNPFKQDKKGMMIDEADEFVTRPQHKTKRSGDHHSMGSPRKRRSLSPSTSKKLHSSGKAALASRSLASLSRSSASPSRSSGSSSRSGSPSRSSGSPSRSSGSPSRSFSSKAYLSRAFPSRSFPSAVSAASTASASVASASVASASASVASASVASEASTSEATVLVAAAAATASASVAMEASTSEKSVLAAAAATATASVASASEAAAAAMASASEASASVAAAAAMASASVEAAMASASVALASEASTSEASASEAPLVSASSSPSSSAGLQRPDPLYKDASIDPDESEEQLEDDQFSGSASSQSVEAMDEAMDEASVLRSDLDALLNELNSLSDGLVYRAGGTVGRGSGSLSRSPHGQRATATPVAATAAAVAATAATATAATAMAATTTAATAATATVAATATAAAAAAAATATATPTATPMATASTSTAATQSTSASGASSLDNPQEESDANFRVQILKEVPGGSLKNEF